MLALNLPDKGPLRILCLGAHCDDIEIGCGGMLRRLINAREAEVYWQVFSSNDVRAEEARLSARRFLSGASAARVEIERFRNGYFPFIGAVIKDHFEKLKREFMPDIVLTHYRHDRHQDHRTVSDLTWNTFRDHLILEYEIPKFDGDLGVPNMFCELTRDTVEFKVATILECFHSQAEKQWFDRETLEGLMRLRGVECNARAGYAEAFYVRKAALDPGFVR